MSSSPERVLRGTDGATVTSLPVATELRSGTWTRRGGSAVLGDAVTESALSTLAETTRVAARAQGYAVGWAEGRRVSEERSRAAEAEAKSRRTEREAAHEAEHRQAVAALERAARLLQDTVADVCGRVEAQAVELSLQLTEAILGREVALSDDPGADAVRRALALLPEKPTVTVRLHPADVARVATGQRDLPGVTLVGDASLQPGDAIAEADDSVVDATLAAALGRAREVLDR